MFGRVYASFLVFWEREMSRKPIGWRMPIQLKETVDRKRRNQATITAGLLEELARPDRAGRSHSFMCDAGYYRDTRGRFKKMDKFGRYLARRYKVAGT